MKFRKYLLHTFIFVISSLIYFSCNNNKHKLLLPVYGDKKFNGKDTVYHTIGDFSFLNQEGDKITNETVKGKIYVADFFFTTCQSICPEMSNNLTIVQKAFESDDSLLILSHSVNPRHDTVEVLKNYAETYNAKTGKWHFLTGDKKKIYTLALNSYLLNAVEEDGTPEGFLHSEMLLLVDKYGRIRGSYDGTDKPEVLKLIEHVKLLKKEK
jgi:protein SCO1